MAHRLHCSLITPESKVYEADADFVSVPAFDGEVGILPDRSPLVVQLGAGRMKVRADHDEQVWFVDAGFAQVIENRVVVLTQKALSIPDIDRVAAIQDLEQARNMPTTDEDAVRRRARAEASARARLRMLG